MKRSIPSEAVTPKDFFIVDEEAGEGMTVERLQAVLQGAYGENPPVTLLTRQSVFYEIPLVTFSALRQIQRLPPVLEISCDILSLDQQEYALVTWA